MFGEYEVAFNEHYGSRMQDWFNFNFLLDTGSQEAENEQYAKLFDAETGGRYRGWNVSRAEVRGDRSPPIAGRRRRCPRSQPWHHSLRPAGDQQN